MRRFDIMPQPDHADLSNVLEGHSDAPLEDIIEEAVECTHGERISIGDVLEAFGSRSLAPVALLCGLIVIIPPIGMIPGLPAVVGLVLFLFSVQYIFGKQRIWLPHHLENASIRRSKLKLAKRKTRKWQARIDALIEERLTFMTGPFQERLAAIIITILALSLIPLELIPGAVAVPGWALIFFGIGLLARDGLFLAAAFAISCGAAYLLSWFIFIS